MHFRQDTIATQCGQATESVVVRPLQTQGVPRPLWNTVDSLLNVSNWGAKRTGRCGLSDWQLMSEADVHGG